MIAAWLWWAEFWLCVMSAEPIVVPGTPPRPPATVTDLAQWRRDHPGRRAA